MREEYIKARNLIDYINDNHIKNSEIVEKTGANKGNVSKIINKKLQPSNNFIATFENAFEIDLLKYRTNKPDDQYLNIPKISENAGAPYYDVDFIGGFDSVLNDQTASPSFYIDFKPYNDVDCWINVTGKSMSPFISHGDIVALKKVSNWKEFLLFGEIYAVVCDEFRTIKIVGESEKENCFKLIPYSKSPEFSAQDIPIDMIREIYRVKGNIKKFF